MPKKKSVEGIHLHSSDLLRADGLHQIPGAQFYRGETSVGLALGTEDQTLKEIDRLSVESTDTIAVRLTGGDMR